MHMAKFGSAVSPIMTMPHFALILEITPLKYVYCKLFVFWQLKMHIARVASLLCIVCASRQIPNVM